MYELINYVFFTILSIGMLKIMLIVLLAFVGVNYLINK